MLNSKYLFDLIGIQNQLFAAPIELKNNPKFLKKWVYDLVLKIFLKNDMFSAGSFNYALILVSLLKKKSILTKTPSFLLKSKCTTTSDSD